jgi:hypothetical protein
MPVRLILFFLFIHQAMASTREGNSGFVIICPQSLDSLGGEDIDLLDFYEGRDQHGYEIVGGGSKEELLNKWMDRLQEVDPQRATFYRERVENFSRRHQVGDYALTGLIDRGPIRMPADSNCSVAQIAQRMASRNGLDDESFFIVKNLWNRLSELSRAGLILHEIIYAEAIDQGHKNSDATRRLVAWIASNRPVKEYRALLVALQFSRNVNIRSEPINIRDTEILKLMKIPKVPQDSTWTTPCLSQSMFDLSRSFLASTRLQGSTYWMGTEYFKDEHCEVPLVRSTLISEVMTIDKISDFESGYDLSLIKSEFTVYTPEQVISSNLSKAGGFLDWKIGVSKDVTGTNIGQPRGLKIYTNLKFDEESGDLWFTDLEAAREGKKKFAPIPMKLR